tara:strand:- start:2333 stop:2497 length:165 start_codon:yes stop_codon:yes gene_type:complete
MKSVESVICKKERTLEPKKRKTQQKSEILTENSGFKQKYLFKDDLSDSIPSGSL